MWIKSQVKACAWVFQEEGAYYAHHAFHDHRKSTNFKTHKGPICDSPLTNSFHYPMDMDFDGIMPKAKPQTSKDA